MLENYTKSQKRLIIFMPSIDGVGVEKSIYNFKFSVKKLSDVVIITFDKRFEENLINK